MNNVGAVDGISGNVRQGVVRWPVGRCTIVGLMAVLTSLAVPGISAHGDSPRRLDKRRLAAAGIRSLEGQYVRLLTDLKPSAAIDDLPTVFDQAIPIWAEYFETPKHDLATRRWTAYLIQDKTAFRALGLLPAENPDFANGFATADELWLVEQASDYYRRHLFLHEGTHAFMLSMLGDCGAGWYKEGVAELFGSHQWRNARLQLRVMPESREEVPMWGRIRLVREAADAARSLPLEAVLTMNHRRGLSTEQYAWTWALAAMLDDHPRFAQRFHALGRNVREEGFNERFRAAYSADWGDLLTEWEAFVADLDYGYDIVRMAMSHAEASEIASRVAERTIAADRGWQSTGWLLRASVDYHVTASGRYQIARDAQPWPCEPGGVTLDYHDGKPLGALIGALRPHFPGVRPGIAAQTGSRELPGRAERATESDPSFSRPALLRTEARLKPSRDSILYLRVNDNPGKLADNAGTVTVQIQELH